MFFWSKRPIVPAAKPIYGVNLGGWLVLEKWMTPTLFEGLDATDEFTYCKKLDADTEERLRRHRDNFITEADFVWLRDQGIDAVRLPVGYWVFGDEAPYEPTIEWVDKAFVWARATGIKILLDMHGAPGSQNGWDHSGKSGDCGWPQDEGNAIKTLAVLARLTRRYNNHPNLLGIELLNEPKWTVPRRKLLKYYEAAYKMIRAECAPDVWVVFSDNFRPRRWKRKLRGGGYAGVYIDTHQYQTFSKKDKRLDITGHIYKTLVKVPKSLRRMQRYHPVIVGEWSLALDAESLKGLDAVELEAARRAYGAAQLLVYESAAAWFYWSYKTEGGGVWSLRDGIEKGWLPSPGAK
jgi:glucan 1,3-beta-glucosidase